MRITQKEFVKALTENQSIFAGIVRGNFDMEFARETIREQMNKIHRDGIIIEKRIAIARSHDLVFTGGSHLTIKGNQFEKIDCGNCIAYICVESWETVLEEIGVKRMIYIVE